MATNRTIVSEIGSSDYLLVIFIFNKTFYRYKNCNIAKEEPTKSSKGSRQINNGYFHE